METIVKNQTPCAYTIPAWLASAATLTLLAALIANPTTAELVATGIVVLVYLGVLFRLLYWASTRISPDTAVRLMRRFAFAALAGCVPLWVLCLMPFADGTITQFLFLASFSITAIGLIVALLYTRTPFRVFWLWLIYQPVAIVVVAFILNAVSRLL